ncbi:MAG: glycosyltransferase family 39 protein [Solirubrobacterales bacterium]|nr:glycosyltransferase family 39 protein [Solirubrobacterales bacterium]
MARWPKLEALPGRALEVIDNAPWFPVAFLVVVLLASTALRLYGINFYYWIDETITVAISSHPLSEMHQLLKEDGAPPLFYFLLHFWMQIFGSTSEVTTHALSLTFAQLCIPATWWAARPQGRRVAVFATVLVAVIPFLNGYSEETRQYSLMALMSVLVVGSTLRAFVHRQRRYLPLVTLSLAAAMYTHNWGGYMAVATTAAVALLIWKAQGAERKKLLIDGLVTLVIAALLYLPWLPTTLYQAKNTGAPWAEHTVLWTLTGGMYNITDGRDAAACLFLAFGSGLLVAYRNAPRNGIFRREIWVLALLAWGTLLLAWLVGKVTPSWSDRYEAAIIGPLALFVSAGLARTRWMGIFVVVMISCWWFSVEKPGVRTSKSNVATVAAQTHKLMGADPIVFSTQPEQVATLAHYMPWVHNFYSMADRPQYPGVVNWVGLAKKVKNATYAKNLAPIANNMKVGQTLSFVVPYGLLPTAPYLKSIDKASNNWGDLLLRNSTFQFMGVYHRGNKYSSNIIYDYMFKKVKPGAGTLVKSAQQAQQTMDGL